MGGVRRAAAGDTLTLRFAMAQTEPGWRFRCVKNDETCEERVLSGGAFAFETALTAASPVSFARCELYDETDRCILLTNPIHLVTDEKLPIPPERLYEA